jgi:hypothetical protein
LRNRRLAEQGGLPPGNSTTRLLPAITGGKPPFCGCTGFEKAATSRRTPKACRRFVSLLPPLRILRVSGRGMVVFSRICREMFPVVDY